VRGFNVPLDDRERRALFDFADDQDRDAKRQARRFIREGLERVGALTEEGRPPQASHPDELAGREPSTVAS